MYRSKAGVRLDPVSMSCVGSPPNTGGWEVTVTFRVAVLGWFNGSLTCTVAVVVPVWVIVLVVFLKAQLGTLKWAAS